MTHPAIDRATDRAYLAYQYGDAEKLRIRVESHRLYSERSNDALQDWVMGHLALEPGMVVADVGCGPGNYFPRYAARDTQVLGVDASPGMATEARRAAASTKLRALVVTGDAQRLPVRDQTCDRVLCAHMLYHVRDRRAALAELRRIVHPGGRAVLVTNAPRPNRLMEVHRAAALALGYTPVGMSDERFSTEHLGLVQEYFPGARCELFENAFAFPTAESALHYYASGVVDDIQELSEDGSHRAPLLQAVESHLREIVAAEGALRYPKAVACFVATV